MARVKTWSPGDILTATDLNAEFDSLASAPASCTDNAVVRWDGTGGDAIQDSSVVIDNSNNITGVGTLAVSGAVTGVTDLTASGEIKGSRLILPFAYNIVTTTTTLADYYINSAGIVPAGPAALGYAMPRAGSIVSYGIQAGLASVTGSYTTLLDIEVRKNGTGVMTVPQMGFDETTVSLEEETAVQARGTDTFVAGDNIGLYLNWGGDLTLTDLDLAIYGVVEVVFDT